MFLESGLLPNGDVAGSAMGEVIANGTSKMTDQDREAVAVFLESLPPIANPDGQGDPGRIRLIVPHPLRY